MVCTYKINFLYCFDIFFLPLAYVLDISGSVEHTPIVGKNGNSLPLKISPLDLNQFPNQIPLSVFARGLNRANCDFSSTSLLNLGVSLRIQGVTSVTALDFIFSCPNKACVGNNPKEKSTPQLSVTTPEDPGCIYERDNVTAICANCSGCGHLDWQHFHKSLVEILGKDCTQAWVRNHYRWIVWKCAALERKFPQRLKSFYPV